jgi:hypothetical protein
MNLLKRWLLKEIDIACIKLILLIPLFIRIADKSKIDNILI